jgi:SAM-dependent methyltransferase
MSGHWQEFWSGAGTGGAHEVCTGAGEALDGFWRDRFGAAFQAGAASLIELACGAAPLARRAADMSETPLRLVCADISEAAIASLKDEFPAAEAVVADAADPGFDPQSFDLVVSQFGLEYAGEGAFAAAARLVAPGGRLIVVAHLADGAVAKECAANRDILDVFLKLDPLGLAAILIAEEAALDEKTFKTREGEIVAAFRGIEAALAEAPPGGGAAFVRRVMPDLAQLYNRRRAFAPEDAQAWLAGQKEAAEGYAARMAAMVGAALDEAAAGRLREALESEGLRIKTCAPISLKPGGEPAAWHIEAERTD